MKVEIGLELGTVQEIGLALSIVRKIGSYQFKGNICEQLDMGIL